jgi:hypothetical protein
MNRYNLSVVLHYKNHPQMMPFIGKNWKKIGKILLIGESHSLKGLADEKIIKDWYILKKENLNKDQVDNTSTETMIKNGLDGSFGENRIYSEINETIKGVDCELDITYFAFMNFYQRPAMKEHETFDKKDDSIANKTVNEVIKILKPDYIFFLSSTAWDRLNIEYNNKILMDIFDNKKIGHSCHPTNIWWNKESDANSIFIGNKNTKITGKMTFEKFLKKVIEKKYERQNGT